MSEDSKDRKQLVYQIVPRNGEPLWKQSFTAFAKPGRTNDFGQHEPGEVFSLEPNGIGQYVIPANHPRFDACQAAMERAKERNNHNGQPPRIIGPFDTTSKAMEEMGKVRPRTYEETAAEALAQRSVFEDRANKAEGQLSELKRRIIELESQKSK